MPTMFMNPPKETAPSSVYEIKDMDNAELPMESVKDLLDDSLAGRGTDTCVLGDSVVIKYNGECIGRIEQPSTGEFEFITDVGGEHCGVKSLDDVVDDVCDYIDKLFDYQTVTKMESIIKRIIGNASLCKALTEGLHAAYGKNMI